MAKENMLCPTKHTELIWIIMLSNLHYIHSVIPEKQMNAGITESESRILKLHYYAI